MVGNITLVGDRELALKLRSMPEKVRHALEKKCTFYAFKLHNYIITTKLSGQVLNHRSGKLWQSIHDKVTSTSTTVTGAVYSSGDIKYAAIHEFGGVTPAHVIEAKNAKALAFMMGGKMVFAKSVNHPGSRMPERSFMRSSLRDMQEEIKQGLRQAVEGALQ